MSVRRQRGCRQGGPAPVSRSADRLRVRVGWYFICCCLAALTLLPASVDACAQVTRFVGPHGARIIVQPDSNSDAVAICVLVKAGVAEDGNALGIGALTARALFGKNLNQSAEEVNNCIYDVGGSLDNDWNPDYTLFTCVTNREQFENAFFLVCQAAKNAEFDDETLRRAYSEVAAGIQKAESDPFQAAYAALRARMYHESPYREPFGGSTSGLRHVTRYAVQRFYQRWYTPGNTVFAVVGNITVARVREAVENQLVDFSRPDPPAPEPYRPESITESARVETRLSIHTTMLLAGFPGPGLLDPDYPAFMVLTSLIGGGKSSRLFRTVRDTDSVGYAIGATAPPLVRESQLLAFVEYDPDRAGPDGKQPDEAAVEKLVLDTVESVISRPPTDAEVERAKRYTIGTNALAHQRARDRAFYLGWYELMGAGYEFDSELPKKIDAVTREDVLRVARKYLAHHVISVVEPVQRP